MGATVPQIEGEASCPEARTRFMGDPHKVEEDSEEDIEAMSLAFQHLMLTTSASNVEHQDILQGIALSVKTTDNTPT